MPKSRFLRCAPLLLPLAASFAAASPASVSAARSGAEAPSGGPSASARPPASFAVVELFTSEGCSSCPPADHLLSTLASKAEKEGKDVYPLSFHVDYWNYLGWSDPFSREEFSDRQQEYARGFDGRVYTPQMIVNGAQAFVGSSEGEARRAIKAALAQPAAAAVSLESARQGADLKVNFRVTGHSAGDRLLIALAEKGLSVPVKRGENGGRTLRHDNVVRAFADIRLAADGSGSVALAVPAGANLPNSSVVAYVQQADSRHIIGAARLTPIR